MVSRTLLLAFLSAISADAFSVSQGFPSTTRQNSLFLQAEATSTSEEVDDEPRMNPDNPNLPELKGDFDWDAKFGDDDDWITEDVPGKIVLNEIDLAKQVTALNQLETKWRKEREIEEYEADRKTGFVEVAELANGRFAMFFLATGLLTELWTGVSMPGQVEEMLRIGGFIGFD